MNRPGATSLLRRDTSGDKTDYDILKENHRFLWDSDDDDYDDDGNPDTSGQSSKLSWGQRLAKKYYDNLFKEFTICDLSRYKENKVAMRWRTEAEVMEGKGQFVCGDKSCSVDSDLRTWEVNFKYEEQGQTKNALVKQRLCPKCSEKLNYGHQRKEIKDKKHKKRKREKRDEDEGDTKKGKHGVRSASSPSSSSHDSDVNQLGSKSCKKRTVRGTDAGEHFLDQFWEDMMT